MAAWSEGGLLNGLLNARAGGALPFLRFPGSTDGESVPGPTSARALSSPAERSASPPLPYRRRSAEPDEGETKL